MVAVVCGTRVAIAANEDEVEAIKLFLETQTIIVVEYSVYSVFHSEGGKVIEIHPTMCTWHKRDLERFGSLMLALHEQGLVSS